MFASLRSTSTENIHVATLLYIFLSSPEYTQTQTILLRPRRMPFADLLWLEEPKTIVSIQVDLPAVLFSPSQLKLCEFTTASVRPGSKETNSNTAPEIFVCLSGYFQGDSLKSQQNHQYFQDGSTIFHHFHILLGSSSTSRKTFNIIQPNIIQPNFLKSQ